MQNNLRKFRKLKGWSLKEMASQTGYDFRTVAGYETNVRPSPEFIRKASEVFSVSESEILNSDSEKDKAELPKRDVEPRIRPEIFTDDQLLDILAKAAEEFPTAKDTTKLQLIESLRATVDELHYRVLKARAETPAKTVTAITKHGIVREEHADIRGVSSTTAERVKKMAAGAAEASRRREGEGSQPSSKAVSTSDNKDEPSPQSGRGLNPANVPPKTAPK